MIDLTERIFWRAKKKNIKLCQFSCNEFSIFSDNKFVPLICHAVDNNYTLIGNFGLKYRYDCDNKYVPYEEISGVSIETNLTEIDQTRVFLEGVNSWISVPSGEKFHGFVNIIMMCTRVAGADR